MTVFGIGKTVLGEDFRLLDCTDMNEKRREGGGNIKEGTRRRRSVEVKHGGRYGGKTDCFYWIILTYFSIFRLN